MPESPGKFAGGDPPPAGTRRAAACPRAEGFAPMLRWLAPLPSKAVSNSPWSDALEQSNGGIQLGGRVWSERGGPNKATSLGTAVAEIHSRPPA